MSQSQIQLTNQKDAFPMNVLLRLSILLFIVFVMSSCKPGDLSISTQEHASTAIKSEKKLKVIKSSDAEDNSNEDSAMTVETRQSHVDVVIQKGHRGQLSAIVAWPDGNLVATAGEDGLIKIWELNTGRLQRTLFGHCMGITKLALSEDGKRLASASHEGPVIVWDTSSWTIIQRLKSMKQTTTIALSPAGDRVLTGGNMEILRLWNVDTGQEIQSWQMNVTAAAMIRNGNAALVGNANFVHGKGSSSRAHGSVYLIDFDGDNPPTELFATSDRAIVQSLAVSPDGKQALTLHDSKSAKLWNLETRSEIAVLNGHTQKIKNISFFPDSAFVLTAAGDCARVWSVPSGKQIATVGEYLPTAIPSYDGSMVLAGSSWLQVWDWKKGEKLRDFPRIINESGALVMHPDGKHVIVGHGFKILQWDLSKGNLDTVIDAGFGSKFLSLSGDGKRMLQGGYALVMWDLEKGKELWRQKEDNEPRSGAISPSGNQVIVAAFDDLELRNPETGKLKKKIKKVKSPQAVAIFSDEKRFLAGGIEPNLSLLKLPKRKIWSTDEWYDVGMIHIGSSEEIALIGRYAPPLAVWDIKKGTERLQIDMPHDMMHGVIARFSPDERLVLASASGMLPTLFDATTGKVLHTLVSPGRVQALGFSKNGRALITVGADSELRVWKTSTGEEIARFVMMEDGEWIVLTSSGAYNGSEHAERHLHVLTSGRTEEIDSFVARFRDPETVAQVLQKLQ